MNDVLLWEKDYCTGMSTREIAKKYNTSNSTVTKKLRSKGLVLRTISQAKTIITREQEFAIVEMYSEGLSMADCERETGFSIDTVHRVLVKHNIETSKGRRIKFRRKTDQEKISRLYLQGWSLAELETELNTSRDSIKAVLRLCGIKIKSYGELKGHVFFDKKGREFHMRSGWEIAYAKYLDANDVEWDYERESFPIDTRTYTPDFWIYKKGVLDKLVEIKGWYRADAKKRVKMFRSLYPDVRLIVLREHNLKKMKVL